MAVIVTATRPSPCVAADNQSRLAPPEAVAVAELLAASRPDEELETAGEDFMVMI